MYLHNPASMIVHDLDHLSERCNSDQIETPIRKPGVIAGYSFCEHCGPEPYEGLATDARDVTLQLRELLAPVFLVLLEAQEAETRVHTDSLILGPEAVAALRAAAPVLYPDGRPSVEAALPAGYEVALIAAEAAMLRDSKANEGATLPPGSTRGRGKASS